MKKILFILLISTVFSCAKESKNVAITILESSVDYRINDILFINENIGFAVGGDRFNDGYILKTKDAGEHWARIEEEKFSKEVSFQTFNSIDFLNDSIGEVVGHGGKIARTVDGGNTWDLILNGTWNNFYDVALLSEKKSVIASGSAYNKGHFFNSSEFWYSFDIVKTDYAVRDITFVNNLIGYSAGYGYVNKTVDGGETWTVLDITGDYFFNMDFVNTEVGYVCGWEGSIFKTLDGGKTWENVHGVNQAFSRRHHFENIDFIDENTGIVCGYNGEVLYTNNGGEKWFSIETNTDIDFHSIYFLNKNTAFVGGKEGLFLKLTF